jgi:hypothetical protein
MLTNAYSARDRLADLTGPDDHNYIFHSYTLVRSLLQRPMGFGRHVLTYIGIRNTARR